MLYFKDIPLVFVDGPGIPHNFIAFLNPKGVVPGTDPPQWGGLAQILQSSLPEALVAKNSLDRIFCYHPPFGTQQTRYVQLREAAKAFAQLITDLTLPSREQSVALTNVQQTVMWANAAIAINEVAAPAPAETPSGNTAAEPAINQESV